MVKKNRMKIGKCIIIIIIVSLYHCIIIIIIVSGKKNRVKMRKCNSITWKRRKMERAKKNNRLCRAGGKLGSSWLLATTLSMVFLN